MGYPNATRVSSLLSQIRIERGWCLPPGSDEHVRTAMADGLTSVVDLLIRIELETNPDMCDAQTRRWLSAKVEDWLFAPSGAGVESGLPI